MQSWQPTAESCSIRVKGPGARPLQGDLESGLPAAAMQQGDRARIGSGYGLKP